MLKFLTGAAAIALAASAVHADPGGGKGGGQGKGGGGGNGHVEQMQAPGGGHGGGNAKADRGPGGEARSQQRAVAQADHGNGKAVIREVHGNGNGNGKGHNNYDARVKSNPGHDGAVREARGNAKGPNRADVAQVREDNPRVRNGRNDRGRFDWAEVIPDRARGLVAGCPPGLAKKNNGCMPPGLAKSAALAPLAFADRPDWWDFDNRWYDGVGWNEGNYRYYDGYMVRYGDNGIDGWVPLLGGALAPGNVWPDYYAPVSLPSYYQDYYGLGQPNAYRYYDDALYRVDPQTNMISSIAGLPTGDPFAVGQPLPAGYDVYNVPYSYRDRYVDGPDANYRYSDGYVYEVDPTTQLVQAAIQLLT